MSRCWIGLLCMSIVPLAGCDELTAPLDGTTSKTKTSSAAPPAPAGPPAPPPPPAAAAVAEPAAGGGLAPDLLAGLEPIQARLEVIGTAIRQYQDRFGKLPAAARRDEAGQPLLSWRVALLPQLGHADLYRQFRTDERWDSPHNRPLTDKMPSLFRATAEGVDSNKTNLLAAVGPRTLQAGDPPGAGEIVDGAGETIFLVEANAERAVVWTAPDDYAFDPASPIGGLGGVRTTGFFALMADGGVRLLSGSAPAESVRGLFTWRGGEPVDLAALTISLTPAAAPAVAVAETERGGPGRPERPPGDPNRRDLPRDERPPDQLAGGGPSREEAFRARGAGELHGGEAPREGEGSNSKHSAGWLGDAEKALDEGKGRDAMRYLNAAALAGKGAERGGVDLASDMAWFDGLRRPALAIRIGIGWEVTGQPTVNRNRRGGPERGGPSLDEFDRVTFGLGREMVEGLATRSAEGSFGELLARTSDGQRAEASPALQLLGPGEQKELVDVARREGCDVILLAIASRRQAVARKPARGGKTQRGGSRQPSPSSVSSTLTLRLIDVWKGRTFWSGDPLSSVRIAAAEQAGGRTDPKGDLVEEFDKAVDRQLQRGEVPAMTAEIVARRAGYVAAGTYEDQLAPLAELEFYVARDLLPREEAVPHLTRLLDEETAKKLSAGDTSRRQVIESLLPGGRRDSGRRF